MEATFISIHDLNADARILYSSDSVVDILGYTPGEIVNRSAWDFFHSDELPYARKFHERRVSMDTAAVLAYCRVLDKQGHWVRCRALAAPVVRRIFTSSPKDPRYHMLSHLSAKFAQPYKQSQHEPRSALFLNRFTRTMSIMYATTGLVDVIGIPASEVQGCSFYSCIAENCLQDAVNCLENAKGNDSIAYLRFWFRDPRLDNPRALYGDDSDEEMNETTTTETSEDNDEGGVHIQSRGSNSSRSTDSSVARSSNGMDVDGEQEPYSRHSSDESTHRGDTHEGIFGQSRAAESSASSLAPSPERDKSTPPRPNPDEPIELEAVISCTSDGLVVCLRRARPLIPTATARPSQPAYPTGFFAAPWATQSIIPPVTSRAGAGYPTIFAPALGPQAARHEPTPSKAGGGPDAHDYMKAIRDQAIFAWALTAINGTLADHSKGKPTADAMPEDGLPIWASDPGRSSTNDFGRRNGVHNL